MTSTALDGLSNVFVASARGFWCEAEPILSAAVIGLPLNSMNMLRIRRLITKYKIDFNSF